MSRVGTAGYVSRYKNKCHITDLIFTLEPFNCIDIDYLYLYLNANRKQIECLRAQNATPNISWYNLQNFEIPVPPLNIQKQLVEQINHINLPSSHYQIYAKCLEQEIANIN